MGKEAVTQGGTELRELQQLKGMQSGVRFSWRSGGQCMPLTLRAPAAPCAGCGTSAPRLGSTTVRAQRPAQGRASGGVRGAWDRRSRRAVPLDSQQARRAMLQQVRHATPGMHCDSDGEVGHAGVRHAIGGREPTLHRAQNFQ